MESSRHKPAPANRRRGAVGASNGARTGVPAYNARRERAGEAERRALDRAAGAARLVPHRDRTSDATPRQRVPRGDEEPIRAPGARARSAGGGRHHRPCPRGRAAPPSLPGARTRRGATGGGSRPRPEGATRRRQQDGGGRARRPAHGRAADRITANRGRVHQRNLKGATTRPGEAGPTSRPTCAADAPNPSQTDGGRADEHRLSRGKRGERGGPRTARGKPPKETNSGAAPTAPAPPSPGSAGDRERAPGTGGRLQAERGEAGEGMR